MFFKINVFKNFTIFTGKHLCFICDKVKLQAFRPANLLNRDCNTGVSLQILQNFQEQIFYRTASVAASRARKDIKNQAENPILIYHQMQHSQLKASFNDKSKVRQTLRFCVLTRVIICLYFQFCWQSLSKKVLITFEEDRERLLPLFIRRDLGTSQSICQDKKNQLPCLLRKHRWKTQQNTLKSSVKRQTNHGQTELTNMLVKKNVLNEINIEGTFAQGFKDCRKIKTKASQNLDDLQNLLIKLANC